jgi:hypothetical protein
MTASPVRVDAGVEADVRAVVARDDGTGMVTEVDGLGGWLLAGFSGVGIHRDPLEAVLRVARSTAAGDATGSLLVPHLWILMDGSGYTTARFERASRVKSGRIRSHARKRGRKRWVRALRKSER